jgi:hypothetical protein
MVAHILPPLAVNSKSERKVNSLSPLGFELVIFGMLAHLCDHSTKSHPHNINVWKLLSFLVGRGHPELRYEQFVTAVGGRLFHFSWIHFEVRGHVRCSYGPLDSEVRDSVPGLQTFRVLMLRPLWFRDFDVIETDKPAQLMFQHPNSRCFAP